MLKTSLRPADSLGLQPAPPQKCTRHGAHRPAGTVCGNLCYIDATHAGTPCCPGMGLLNIPLEFRIALNQCVSKFRVEFHRAGSLPLPFSACPVVHSQCGAMRSVQATAALMAMRDLLALCLARPSRRLSPLRHRYMSLMLCNTPGLRRVAFLTVSKPSPDPSLKF